MNIRIAEVRDPHQKSRIAEDILRRLPEWFGIEKALQAYGMPLPCLSGELGRPTGRASVSFASQSITAIPAKSMSWGSCPSITGKARDGRWWPKRKMP